jgi:hypothetical protein
MDIPLRQKEERAILDLRPVPRCCFSTGWALSSRSPLAPPHQIGDPRNDKPDADVEDDVAHEVIAVLASGRKTLSIACPDADQ